MMRNPLATPTHMSPRKLTSATVALFLASACTPTPEASPAPTQEAALAHTPTALQSTSFPTPSSTSEETPAACPGLVRVEAGEPGVWGPGSEPFVLLARWVDSSQLVFAARTGDTLSWYQLDSRTGEVEQVMAPIQFDAGALEALAPDSFVDFPETKGHISPSGAFFLYTKTAFASSQSPGTTEVHLYDLRSAQDRLLLSERPGAILQGYWAPDETAVFFDMTREGGAPLYTANTATGPASSLAPLIGSEAISGEQWTLSPDGAMIAAVDTHDQLMLAHVLEGTAAVIPGPAMRPSFSQDSNTLYFYSGTSLEPEASELVAYQLNTGQTQTLVTPSELATAAAFPEDATRPSLGGLYSVSPDDAQIAFYFGSLWLLRQCK